MARRPINKENKQHLCISLDRDIVMESKIRGENLSGLINDLLISYFQLNNKSDERRIDEVNKKIEAMSAELLSLKQNKKEIEDTARKRKEEYQDKLQTEELIIAED